MPSAFDPDFAGVEPTPARTGWQHALTILWPAFVAAGALEALVFAFVDPRALHWSGADPLRLSAIAVYSIAFLLFWAVIAAASATTQWLEVPGPDPDR